MLSRVVDEIKPHERSKRFQITPVDLGEPQPGVDINDNTALLELIENDE